MQNYYNNSFCTSQVLCTVISVLPIFEEHYYFPSNAHIHCVQPDFKLFSQHLWFQSFLSGYLCLVVVTKLFCHKVAGVKCLSSAPNTWRGCRSCFSAVIQLEYALAQILIAINVCRGSIPQAFFVLHPAARNRSLKNAQLAITLYYRLFVYICMHAQSRNDAL